LPLPINDPLDKAVKTFYDLVRVKKLTAFGVSSIAFFLGTVPAFAQSIGIDPCPKGKGATGVDFTSLCGLSLNGGFVSRLITLFLVIAALIALGFLIYGGIRWILSGGEKEKVEEARGTIIAALVGLVIVFAAYFIINIVFGLFNLGSISSLNAVPLLNIFGK
jgi:hypothetical protein